MRIVITTGNLQEGMYMVCKGQPHALQNAPAVATSYSFDGYAVTDEMFDRLREEKIAEVRIDPARTLIPFDTSRKLGAPAVISPRKRHQAFLKDIENTEEIQKKGIDIVRELETKVNKGEALPVEDTKEVVRAMLESLAHNRNVLLSLTRLKKWDAYTYTHSMNVALYGTLLCKYIGVEDSIAEEVGVAGFFHDIGKLFIPLEIINSPNKLSDEQFSLMKRHPEFGEKYVQKLPGITDTIRRGILEHHERWDGSGYLTGKKGSQISLAGQVLMIADVYDALSSRRSYKAAMPAGDALALMYRERKNSYSPGMLESFIKAVGVYPSGCVVRLNDNSVAIVTEQTRSSLQPQVVILIDGKGEPLDPPQVCDLTRHRNLAIRGCAPEQVVPMDLNEAISAAG